MYRLINNFGKYADHLASNFVWANTYGLGRSLLAMGLLITLTLNDISLLVAPLGADVSLGQKLMMPMARMSLYHLFPGHLIAIKIFSIIVLASVVIGWRPRITGILHWWVAFSYVNGALIVDGGDQIGQVLALLLVPLCLADGRKWHWTTVDSAANTSLSFSKKAFNLMGISTLFIIQLQVAFIYFHAGIGKLGSPEWINGTAIFYWVQNPLFGACDTLRPFLIALFEVNKKSKNFK